MKIKKPIIKRPESKDELIKLETETRARLKEIIQKEDLLKSEYSCITADHNKKIDELKVQRRSIEKQIKDQQAKQRREQLDNRNKRKVLADERIRLQYDLQSLKSRFNSFIYGQREKVARSPGIALELMERQED